MFSHIFVGVSQFERALAFYTPVMAALGIELRFCDASKPWAAWQSSPGPRPLFIIGHPFDGQPHAPGNGQMAGLLASSRAQVEAAHAAALASPACVRTTTPTTTAPISATPTATSWLWPATKPLPADVPTRLVQSAHQPCASGPGEQLRQNKCRMPSCTPAISRPTAAAPPSPAAAVSTWIGFIRKAALPWLSIFARLAYRPVRLDRK